MAYHLVWYLWPYPSPDFVKTAVTCIADAHVRLAASVLLRRRGYRVIEAATVEEAKSLVTDAVILIVSGELADPTEELGRFANERGIGYAHVGPYVSLDALLRVVDEIPPQESPL
jgi:hypothetical protein